MSNLHPVFERICASIQALPVPVAVSADEQLAHYVALLQRHDWAYEYADDGAVWRAGRDERRELATLRDELDPDGALWNKYAPPCYRFGRIAC